MKPLCLEVVGRKTIANEFAARSRGEVLSDTEELQNQGFKSLILKATKSIRTNIKERQVLLRF